MNDVKIVRRVTDIPFDELENGYYFEKATGVLAEVAITYDRELGDVVEFTTIDTGNVQFMFKVI